MPSPRVILSHRTTRGRIIYDRPTHFFSLPDITRVIRNVRGAKSQYTLPQVLAFYSELLLLVNETLPNLSLLVLDGGPGAARQAGDAVWALFMRLADHLLQFYTNEFFDWLRLVFHAFFPEPEPTIIEGD